MELLIPGLILVALMVYASTRIKRVAAEAFEPESIDTPDFALEKPAGILSVVSPRDGLSFEGYSKDFGTGEASNIKAVRTEARVYKDRKLNALLTAIREVTDVSSEVPEMIDGTKYIVVEAASLESGIGMREYYKLAQRGSDVVELKLTVVDDMEEFAAKAESMLASFVVK